MKEHTYVYTVGQLVKPERDDYDLKGSKSGNITHYTKCFTIKLPVYGMEGSGEAGISGSEVAESLVEIRAKVPAAVTVCEGFSREKGSAGPVKEEQM